MTGDVDKYYNVSINRTDHYRVKAKNFSEAILKVEIMRPYCTESYGYNAEQQDPYQIDAENYK